jgi:hypothetical protein
MVPTNSCDVAEICLEAAATSLVDMADSFST